MLIDILASGIRISRLIFGLHTDFGALSTLHVLYVSSAVLDIPVYDRHNYSETCK
jgi:hypothetical protein